MWKTAYAPTNTSQLHFLGQNSMKRFVGSVSRKAMGNRAHLGYVDSHCHLFARQFKGRIPEILKLGRDVGLEYAIINGLEPKTNRITLDMCSRYPEYLPAIGIYPLEACCNAINEDNWKTDMRPPQKFDVDAEVDFIDEMCAQKKIIAIGEAGLDAHYVNHPDIMKEQIRVLRKLMKLSVKHDLPIILHTRKAEERVLEMLLEEKVKKADIHSFTGTTKVGLQYAEAGYHLSIPSYVVSPKAKSFRELAKALPLDKLLTETDSPYMAPDKSMVNDPSTVVQSIKTLAELRGSTVVKMRTAVRNNFKDLFGV